MNLDGFENIESFYHDKSAELGEAGPYVFLLTPEDRRRGWVRSDLDPGALELIDVDQARERAQGRGLKFCSYLDSESYPYA